MPHLVSPLEGRWWLPSQSRRSRRGILHNGPNGGFELTIDSAWDYKTLQSLDAKEDLVFLGRSDSDRPVTLMHGFLEKWTIPGGSRATFHFDQAFLGGYFPDAAQAEFTEISVRVTGLDEWLGISGVKVEYDPNSWAEVSVHFAKPRNIDFELGPGLKFIFSFAGQGPTLRRPQLEASLHQELWFKIQSLSARPFSELYRIASRMLDLFTLLVGESLIFKAVYAQPSSIRKGRSRTVDILFSPVGEEAVKPVESHRMLLRFEDIQTRLPRLFSLWLESFEALQPAFDIYFSMQRRDPTYQEQRFLGLVTALEALHRLRGKEQPSNKNQERVERILEPLSSKDKKWLKGRLKYSYEKTLATRLGELLQPFGDLFGGPDQRKKFVEKVADTRNYLTHYNPVLSGRAVRPSRLLPYLYRLRVLFVLHCLLSLGFSAPEARRAVEKNHKFSQMVRFGKL